MILCRNLRTAIEQWVARAYEVLTKTSGTNGESLKPVFDAIYQEIRELHQTADKVSRLWYEDARDTRKKLEKESTALYEITQKILELTPRMEQLEASLNHTKAQLKDSFQEKQQLELRLSYTNQRLAKFEHHLHAMHHSTSWRITAPLRAFKAALTEYGVFFLSPSTYAKIFLILKNQGVVKTVKKTAQLWKRGGLRGVLSFYKRQVQTEALYMEWIHAQDTLTTTDCKQIKAHIEGFANKPLISVVMPVYNIDICAMRLSR